MSFQAFRDRYPDAQILSELLLVERERFVVKVTITTASSGVASGLATHTAIEVAEDQARLRAMAALGYAATEPVASASPLHPQSTAPLPAPESAPEPSPSQSAMAAPISPPTATERTPKPKPSPSKPAKAIATSQTVAKIQPQPEAIEPQLASFEDDDSHLDGDDFEETIAPTEEPLPVSEAPPEPAAAPISAESLPAPINLSDVIAQTDIELRRLGWSVETGREYLEQTYQKRSRHELSEEELIQFLCHLESL